MVKIIITLLAVVCIIGFIVQSQSVDTDPNATNQQIDAQPKNTATAAPTNYQEPAVVREQATIPSRNVRDLSGQGLTKVLPSTFSDTSVRRLDLSNNNLTGTLPAEVRQLQNLTELDLSNNQFTGVPAEIGQLQKLQVLDLSNNQLTGLPYELGNLSNLQVLNLKGNAYAEADLAIIKKQLPATATVLVD